jgi:hypothetical protein
MALKVISLVLAQLEAFLVIVPALVVENLKEGDIQGMAVAMAVTAVAMLAIQ